ncbi:hypothetical protein CASFOL_030690 [Castilleja foliolosa]|uniref:Peptidase C1A papain C-terminal domain-containing protein n=1 Tax=Castilleja foliolosa TaxID=1961234 RepID=A0ABD3C617_9LAMI
MEKFLHSRAYSFTFTSSQMDSFPNLDYMKQATFCWPRDRPNHVLGIRNQGSTKSSYAFSVVNTIYADLFPALQDESSRGINLHNLSPSEASEGSPQELIDFLHLTKLPFGRAQGDEPGESGWANNFDGAFSYVQKWGLFRECQYRFVGKYQKDIKRVTYCPEWKISIKKFKEIDEENDEKRYRAIVEQLTNQPLTGSILMAESLRNWRYTDGIYQGLTDEERRSTRHAKLAITLIGYGTEENKQDYYWVQSSSPETSNFIQVRRDLISKIFYPVGSHIKQMTESVFDKLRKPTN